MDALFYFQMKSKKVLDLECALHTSIIVKNLLLLEMAIVSVLRIRNKECVEG